MPHERYLCSQLVKLRNISGDSALNTEVDQVVNLEEIWESGAVLEAEEAWENGVRVEVRCGPFFFAGQIVEVEQHELGWRIDVEFSPLTPWSLEKFQPQHLVNVSQYRKPG